MQRPEYPSDERRRKNKPAVRVHLSWPNHPRFGHVYDDLELRGVVVGIWLVAMRAHASKTNNEVTLSAADLLAITGRSRPVDAAKLLRRACEAMAYDLRMTSDSPARWVIGVRNFARKQGWDSAGRVDDSATPDASESESKSASESDLLFERAWAKYPKRGGGANPKIPALEAWRARLKEGAGAEALESAVERYARFCEATGKAGTDFVQQAATFFGPKKRGFEEKWEIPTNGSHRTDAPKRTATDWEAEARRAHASSRND